MSVARGEAWKNAVSGVGRLLRQTVEEWLEDGIPTRGAALSYYVLLSLGPILVLVVGALESVLSGDAARGRVVNAIRSNLGARAAQTVETVLREATIPDLLAPESILTILLLLFGATAVFANVRGALNTIWGVAPEHESKMEMVFDYLRARARGFVMVVLTGFVILLSFLVTSARGVVSRYVDLERLIASSYLLSAVDLVASVVVVGLLFAAIFRTLPAVRIPWRVVWVGAFSTALLFMIGKSLVTWLITSASWTSYYGPGASIVAFLAWIYFSAQIFFLGAEFTQVWARRHGFELRPSTEADRPEAELASTAG